MLNVLLMLSTRQPPDPVQEVAWHERHCAEHGHTFLVTTRTIKDLVPGNSCVAFYGDSNLQNAYLGCGCFQDHIPIDSREGGDILETSELYRRHGIPERAREFIELTDFRAAQPGESIDRLRGLIRAEPRRPLTLKNVPPGASRAQVYFLTEESIF